MPERFSARIGKVGVDPAVDVPARVSRALGRTGYIPVRGELNGVPFEAGLVSNGGGRHRLFVNGSTRKAAGVETGDTVRVTIEYDPEPRALDIPERLAEAIAKDKALEQAWLGLTPSSRKEIVAYVGSLKRPDSVDRNAGRLVRELKGE